MSATPDGGSAFPFGQISEVTGQPINGFFDPGMTLRDWFAGQALPSLIADAEQCNERHIEHGGPPLVTCADVAESCYSYADAMLLARKTQPGGQE